MLLFEKEVWDWGSFTCKSRNYHIIQQNVPHGVCVRACVRACVRVCVCACMCVCVCVCVFVDQGESGAG